MLLFTAIITLHLCSKFSEEETARNSFGPSYIYVHSSTTLSQRILQAQAAAAGAGTRSDSGEKESSSESAIVVHSNGSSSGSDSSSSSGVWLPAAEFQGFSGTIKPVKVCLLSCCTSSEASTPSINLDHCLYELAVQHCA
jgi:hypothetical protein